MIILPVPSPARSSYEWPVSTAPPLKSITQALSSLSTEHPALRIRESGEKKGQLLLTASVVCAHVSLSSFAFLLSHFPFFLSVS